MLKINYISDSWKGVQKDENQDSFHVISEKKFTLFIVFDGVSSSRNSKQGIQKVIDYCDHHYSIYDKPDGFCLAELMEDMNISLLKSGLESAETTCTMMLINTGQKLFRISHLGDSRIYRLGQSMVPLTIDDTHPELHYMLTKCLGLDRLTTDDFYEKELPLNQGSYLLCTDGFYHVMDTFMYEFMDAFSRYRNLPDLKGKLENLVQYHNSDDATYIFIEVGGS